MNKKFLSAILFGALMVTSTGTFVSCKDYDDDIDRIDNTLKDLKSQIDALQTAVNNGDYVTGVAKTADGKGITFTFSKGSPVTVTLDVKDGATGAAGKDAQQVTVDEKTGELKIDDEGTGIFPAKDAEKAPVKAEGGYWYVLNDKGGYDNTNIPMSGLSAVGSDAEGWTLTIIDANGNTQVVEVPSAASKITGMEIGKATNLDIFNVEFKFEAQKSAGADIKDAAAWTALTQKNVPADKTRLFRSGDALGLRINPVNIPAEDLSLTLIDSKKNAVNGVNLIATAYKEQLTAGSRSTAYGNGLYALNMKNLEVADKTTADALAKVIKANDATQPATAPATTEVVYAVNANNSFFSNYIVTLQETAVKTLTKLTIAKKDGTIGTVATNSPVVDVNEEIEVTATEDIALYDMYMTTTDEYIRKFKLTFDQDAHTFIVGDNPDVSSLKATFPLYIYTVDVNGKLEKTTFNVEVSSLINKPTEYTLITHNVASNPNMFDFDLATMQNGMSQDLLDKWHMNVVLGSTAYALYTDKDGKPSTTEAGTNVFTNGGLLTPMVVAKVDKDATAETDSHKATAIQVKVDNTKAKAAGLSLNTKYWMVVTFKASTGDLNSIQVPVMFTAPTLAQSFEIESSYQDLTTGIIKAYFYLGNGEGTNGTTAKNIVEMNKYFKKSANVNVALKDDDQLGSAKKSSFAVAQFVDKDETAITPSVKFSSTYIGFNAAAGDKSTTDKRQYGYGEVLTVIASSDYYVINANKTTSETWKYTKDAEKTYSFQIKLMSPIYEGKVTGIDGKAINVFANDLKNGANITDAMIKGYDYNNNPYNVVADKAGTPPAKLAWKDPQISDVTVVEADHTPKLFTTVEATAYTAAVKDTPAENGTIKLVAESVSNETTVDLTVTVKDIWGYVRPFNVPVNIKMNK